MIGKYRPQRGASATIGLASKNTATRTSMTATGILFKDTRERMTKHRAIVRA